MTEEIIIQSEPEKRDKNEVSEKIFYNVSESDWKFLQRVSFWIKTFTIMSDFELNFNKRQILKNYIVLKSMILKKELILKRRFKKVFAHKKSRFDSCYPVKRANFAFYVQF